MKPITSLHLPTIIAAALCTPWAGLAADFHVATAQDLQNALTLAAGNGADNNIWLTNGYYVGNFNFNSTGGHNLTLQAEPGVTNAAITLDGAATGRALNLVNTATGNFTIRGVTFLRNCGNNSIGTLLIGGGGGSSIVVDSCRFLSPGSTSGMGLELAGLNATLTACTVIGIRNSDGIHISVTGDVTVRACTVATNAAGLTIAGAGNIAITNSTFAGNSASGTPSGANCQGTTITLSSDAFTGNSGGPAASCSAGTVTVSGNNFSGNIGTGFINGGGLVCGGTTINLSNNTFYGNNSAGNNSGGGAYCSGQAVTILGNTFFGNYSGSAGGGLYAAYNVGTQTVSGNMFVSNSTGIGGGGGANCAGTVTGNTFLGNSAQAAGGLLFNGGGTMASNTFLYNSAFNGSGGGAYCSGTVTGNTFIGNTAGAATVGNGGGVYFNGGTLSANVFRQNTAANAGGGIYAFGGGIISLIDNLVVKNAQSSSGAQGGGIWVNPSATLYMINNTVFGNVAGGGGGGAAFQVGGTTEVLNVYNNIIWGNSANGNGADVWLAGTGLKKTFLYNDVDNMYGVWDIAQNLIDIDPQYFDPVNGDHHLRSTSPCIDTGTNGAPSLPASDLDGDARIANGTVDMGCYEFSTAAAHPADASLDFVLSSAEFNAYAAAWKSGQTWSNAPTVIPADYVTRAGYLMTNGGVYHNDGSARPVNWKPGP